MRQVAILGAGGFIGGYLARRFSECPEWDARAFCSAQCDLLRPESIREALGGLARGAFLVVAASVNRLRENSFGALAKNVAMAENVARFLAEGAIAHVVFLSSADVYGLEPAGGTIREELIPDPADHYAISKIASESLLRGATRRAGAALTVFRLSGVYGPGDDGKSTINALVRSARSTGTITIDGDGSARRDYLHVEDVFQAAKSALEQRITGTVNLASGESHTIAAIAAMVRDALSETVTVKLRPAALPQVRRIQDMRYDLALLRRLFPCLRSTQVGDGIALYCADEGTPRTPRSQEIERPRSIPCCDN